MLLRLRTGDPVRLGAAQVAGVLAVGGYALLLAWAGGRDRYDLFGALVVIPALLLLTLHLVVRAGRAEQDPFIARLLLWALAAKVLATVARYLMAFVLYNGESDASVYDAEGGRLAVSYRLGFLDANLGHSFIGSGFVRMLTGLIYTAFGTSIYIAFAIFAALSFWGCYFFYRAFRVAVPDGNYHRYAVLVLLLPSMLFWPSGLGKEAWITMGIGLTAFGSARLLTGVRHWLLPAAIGLTMTSLVRPHISAALFVGLTAAMFLRKSTRAATPLTPVVKVGVLAVLMLLGALIVARAATFLNVESVTVSNVDAAIRDTQHRTGEGGSEFTPTVVNSPADLPVATVSVLFRPFVFEADNAQSLIVATEGAVLMLLTLRAVPTLRGLPRRLRRQPYLLMCLVYTLLFVYAFSNFSNFGILTRQRVQVLPFVLVFLALPLDRTFRAGTVRHTTHEEIPA
ncbi:hypothetical protein [Nocardioides mesophilus]|uniref:Uncharacterized protein n=1 Tax=Nocardioides mesophilus TaxID=433659 RepID=A0A7G9R990_9ACTN|nr:hypothetical protein [Nocardioides mesophilus]QNN52165.1 hypothetical protein H9L09_16940 [Nocardioides mesophilus]